jgi:hypothetical protein
MRGYGQTEPHQRSIATRRSIRSATWAVGCRSLTKHLDQSGIPWMPRDQPGFELDVNLEIQPVRHSRPRITRVKLTIPTERKQNQQIPRKTGRILNR